MSSLHVATEFDSEEDEEITLYPDSAAVVGAPLLPPSSSSLVSGKTMSSARGATETAFAESPGPVSVSDLYATWRKTDHVFYFALTLLLFLTLAFSFYFVYVYLGVRRARGAQTDRFGTRWTRLTAG